MKRAIPAIEDQLQLATVRCLAILRRYYGGEQSARARHLMVAEVEMVVGYLLELDLPPGATQAGVLAPVADHLALRHGVEAGRRLNAEFVAIFEGAGMSLLAPPGDGRAVPPPVDGWAAPGDGRVARPDGWAAPPAGDLLRHI